jgi:hypothetical protein
MIYIWNKWREQETYCRVLERYKEELTRPFDEAASFLTGIHTQLASLCGGAPPPTDNSGK